jgi:ComF family protein
VGLQAALHVIYPPQCLTCSALVTTDFGLCGTCWRETPFISGLVCDLCGVPLPGEDPDHRVLCDDCLTIARPWSQGRSAFLYKDNARHMVLALKHGDRLDLAKPAALWLQRTAQPMIRPDMLVVPVPLHWLRFLKRQYNQAAILSAAFAKVSGLEHCPDALLRRRSTGSQEGRTRDGRFANLLDAFMVHKHRRKLVEERNILLIDDVMTSGATFAAASEALFAAGASSVSVLSFARVAKDA